MKSLKLACAFLAFALVTSFTIPNSIKTTTANSDAVGSHVEYRIQLGVYADVPPEEDLLLLNSIPGVIAMESKGKVAYLTPEYSTESQASKELPSFRDKGFKKAMKVVIVEDYVVPARTYHIFYDNKKGPMAEKNKLFETEYRVLD